MANKPKLKCSGIMRMKSVSRNGMKLQQQWQYTTNPLKGEWRELNKVPKCAPDNEFEYILPLKQLKKE